MSLLSTEGFDIKPIASLSPGMTDEEVMKLAIEEQRTIITHDSDYGELIFKHGLKPEAGVIYFRLFSFDPLDPGKIILELQSEGFDFLNRLTVIDHQSIRQRVYN
ncbi:DUF5615 family PIN-like protein [Halocola ammonii]